ncbi:MAG: DUF2867 domain-containing protein [Chloroflexi bacterium]|nr:DUF2867 domain-containing protein [Chloroflexota bacterium]MBI3338887.1 DUF2867 domain-containing protein [Chloroflexota bacterium]
MTNRLILVTGANGYIASRLIPRLLESGYRVRAMARDARHITGRKWSSRVEMVSGDVTSPQTFKSALDGVHTAYYLIHNMSSGRGYISRELESGRNFANAAEKAGVQHIIYLGGLADPSQDIAPHLRSRIETGEALREGKVPVTEFRAGVIAGPGSISFEMIRFITEQCPILPGPHWLKNKSQPIATQNVLDYLLAALDTPNGHDKVFEIGGPDIKVYSDLMLTYARLRGLRRWPFTVPGIPLWFMAWWVDKLTPISLPIAYALIDSLQSDSIVHNDSARRVFPSVQLITYEEAASTALAHLHPDMLERVWNSGTHPEIQLKHEGFFIDYRRLYAAAPPESVYRALIHIGGQNGWPYANWLWKLRGWLDKLLGGPGLRGRSAAIQQGGMMDYYRVESLQQNNFMRLRSELKAPGEGWMEWSVESNDDGGAVLAQTAFFAPRGMPGFLYWYLLNPLRRIVLHGLIRAVIRRSENS